MFIRLPLSLSLSLAFSVAHFMRTVHITHIHVFTNYLKMVTQILRAVMVMMRVEKGSSNALFRTHVFDIAIPISQ